MPDRDDSRSEVAASLARAARVPAVVLGRVSLVHSQVVDAVVATSSGPARLSRETLARLIGKTVRPLASAGPDGGLAPRRGRSSALWLASERCLVGLWADPPPVAPFVALIGEQPEDVAAPWRRDVARVGLVFETERLRAQADRKRLEAERARADPDRGALAEEILRLIAIGLVLCDREGRVIYANSAAEEWMRARGAISVRDGRLAARRPDLRRRLELALETAAVGEPRAPGALALQRGDGETVPDVVSVLPFAGAPCALVVFGGHDWDAGRADLAMRALNLTGAERRLVGYLCQGGKLNEAAAKADVTIHTARTYLKRVYAKTGTHGQSELVSLMASLSPPVAVRGPLDLGPADREVPTDPRPTRIAPIRPDSTRPDPKRPGATIPLAKNRL